MQTDNQLVNNVSGKNGDRLMLECENLSKRYEDNILALDNLNLHVKQGEIYAMLGANGAGKTTTINLFLNYIEPTSGEARVNGIVTHLDPLQAKKNLAYVSENVMLYPNFTAVQNLDFFARLCGEKKLSEERYHDVLNRVGLEANAHFKKLRDFSKGMRQKCGIAIAIIKNAPAILLDEPTSGLDPKAAREFIDLLSVLRNEGKAILMSTHDIFRAKEIADEIGILSAGKLVMTKRRKELEGQDLEKLYVTFMSGRQRLNEIN